MHMPTASLTSFRLLVEILVLALGLAIGAFGHFHHCTWAGLRFVAAVDTVGRCHSL